MKSFKLNTKTILMIGGMVVLFVVLFSLVAPNIEGFQSGSSAPLMGGSSLPMGGSSLPQSGSPSPPTGVKMLNFAPVPDFSLRGYQATALGDAFQQDISDSKALSLAGITNNHMMNSTNDPKFVGMCADKCDLMNTGTNKYCDGFVLEYNSENKTNPINSCWLKNGSTGLSSSKDRIAYFKT